MRLLALTKCPINVDVNLHCERCGRKRRQAMHAMCAFRHCETERCGKFMASKQAEFGHFDFRVSEDGSAPWNAARMKSMMAQRDKPELFHCYRTSICQLDCHRVAVGGGFGSMLYLLSISGIAALRWPLHCNSVPARLCCTIALRPTRHEVGSHQIASVRPWWRCHNRFRDEVLLKSCSPKLLDYDCLKTLCRLQFFANVHRGHFF